MLSGYESDQTVIIHDEYSVFRRMKTRLRKLYRFIGTLFMKCNNYHNF